MSARSPLVRLGAALLLVALATPPRAARAEAPADVELPDMGAAAAPAPETGPEDSSKALSEASPEASPAPVAPATPPALAPAPPPPERALVRGPDAAKPPHVPLAKRWWFWASLGGAAAAVLLVGLLLGPREPYTGNANPGVEQVF